MRRAITGLSLLGAAAGVALAVNVATEPPVDHNPEVEVASVLSGPFDARPPIDGEPIEVEGREYRPVLSDDPDVEMFKADGGRTATRWEAGGITFTLARVDGFG